MRRRLPLLLVVGALACAHAPTPPPNTPRRGSRATALAYIVSYSSYYGGASKARNACVRDANAFCAAHGAPMRPIDEQTVVSSVTSVSLVFACSSEPLPASTTDPLGPDLPLQRGPHVRPGPRPVEHGDLCCDRLERT